MYRPNKTIIIGVQPMLQGKKPPDEPNGDGYRKVPPHLPERPPYLRRAHPGPYTGSNTPTRPLGWNARSTTTARGRNPTPRHAVAATPGPSSPTAAAAPRTGRQTVSYPQRLHRRHDMLLLPPTLPIPIIQYQERRDPQRYRHAQPRYRQQPPGPAIRKTVKG